MVATEDTVAGTTDIDCFQAVGIGRGLVPVSVAPL